MATNLPTLSVQDAQATRILDAFKALSGATTTAETARAYKKWLAGQVRSVVMDHESAQIDVTNSAAKTEALTTLQASLPDPDAIT